jgi:predicted neutral ceramidase superfamily lipid hydrolase
MKYKHVFKIWILADAFLALSLTIYLFITIDQPLNSKDLSDPGFFILIIGWGVIVSIPSLIAMMIFHHFYLKKATGSSNYVTTYIIVILVINALYLACTHLPNYHMGNDFDVFFIFSTLAGLLALFCIDWRIRRAKKLEPVDMFNEK